LALELLRSSPSGLLILDTSTMRRIGLPAHGVGMVGGWWGDSVGMVWMGAQQRTHHKEE
jgi:hypothetical protein